MLGFPISRAFMLVKEILLVDCNLNKEYLSKPKLFSRYSLIFSNKGNCSSEDVNENTGSISTKYYILRKVYLFLYGLIVFLFKYWEIASGFIPIAFPASAIELYTVVILFSLSITSIF